MTSIVSQDLTIEKLFNDFYVIPSYQREYIWEEQQVSEFIEDIYDEFYANVSGTHSEYFIGSIIVCSRPDGLYEVIDGQQRMTTAYLLLCAMRDYVLEIHPQERIEALKSQIASLYPDEDGNDEFRHRIELQYEDSRGILERIALQENLDELPPTHSVENIKNAYHQLLKFLNLEFGQELNGIPQLKKFYAYFLKHVTLIRVKTASVAHAIKIYSTLNHRGVPLHEMDLLKNLMFAKARPCDYDRINSKWKEMVDLLFDAKEPPMRFLRYFILADYEVDGNQLTESEIYNWFLKNQAKCDYQTHPIAFVNNLVDAAKAYTGFLGGKNPNGTRNRYLTNIRCFIIHGRQHLILPLAGRNLPEACFTELCYQLENLLFISLIVSDRPKTFAETLTRWAGELRQVSDRAGLDALINLYILPFKQKVAASFEKAFRQLNDSSLQPYQIKYILTKLTQFIDEKAWGSGGGIDNLVNYMLRLELDYILPQNPGGEWQNNFNNLRERDSFVKRLGNLTLLEKTLHTTGSQQSFAEKKKVYKHSKFLLTKTIAEPVHIETNTAVDIAVKELKNFDEWTPISIESRQEMLNQLAKKVWKIS